MANKRYKSGELNSLNVDERTGIELDPNRFDPLEKLYHSVKKASTSNHFEGSGKQVARCISVNEGKLGWLANAYDPGDDVPDTEVYTVTAALLEGTDVIYPEIENLDGTFRPQNLFYEDYVSIFTDARRPIPGELIYVEYGNYKNRSSPYYVGPVRPTANNIGTSFIQQVASGFFSGIGSALGLKGPAGDGVGANNPNAGGQNPTASRRPTGVYEIPEVTRLGNLDAYGRGVRIGKIEVFTWKNPDGSRVMVGKDSIPSIINLDRALFEAFNKRIFINSGFRTNEKQKQLRARYGSRAARPGRSYHQSGRAIDISIWDVSLGTRKPLNRSNTPEEWKWFLSNVPTYSFKWERPVKNEELPHGEGERLGEPWHWVYTGKVNILKE